MVHSIKCVNPNVYQYMAYEEEEDEVGGFHTNLHAGTCAGGEDTVLLEGKISNM